jgi:hypothetical protein
MGCWRVHRVAAVRMRGRLGPTEDGGPIRYLESRCFLRFLHAKNRLALCFIDLGSISRPVRQALALNTLKSRRRPLPVSETEFGAVIVPELKLI